MSYKVEKVWKTNAGYAAVCIATSSHRCGYVGVPFGHMLYNVGYSQSTPLLKDAWENAKSGPVGKRGILSIFCAGENDEDNMHPSLVFNVHGGLTYSGSSSDYPTENKDHLWWFGFDCGHAGDGYFAESSMSTLVTGPIRSIDYVVNECESLAKQLHFVGEQK